MQTSTRLPLKPFLLVAAKIEVRRLMMIILILMFVIIMMMVMKMIVMMMVIIITLSPLVCATWIESLLALASATSPHPAMSRLKDALIVIYYQDCHDDITLYLYMYIIIIVIIMITIMLLGPNNDSKMKKIFQ